jgi:octaprenyl-diphosphate synthase
MDIAWHRRFDAIPDIAEYRLMCSLKTGSLARLAAVLGVLAAQTASPQLQKTVSGTTEQVAEAAQAAEILGAAAEKLGVGFQIMDDVKNLTTGNPGKKRGDDIVEGKKSLPILLYLQETGNAGPANSAVEPTRPPVSKKQFVERCFQKAREKGITAPEIEELIEQMETSGVITQARRHGETLIEEAKTIFKRESCAGISFVPEGRGLLTALIDSMGV